MIILIYTNCQGFVLSKFFEEYKKTNINNFQIYYFSNYSGINKEEFNKIFSICDVFIYQHNKGNTNIKYDINKLKCNCIKIKIAWWIFNGFWYDSNWNSYKQIIYNNNKYSFIEMDWNDLIIDMYGIHNSFKNFYGNYKEVKNKIDNLNINKELFIKFFEKECKNFEKIDKNSDISMYNFFINNYKIKNLFYCPIHPTNEFIQELFNKILLKINEELKNIKELKNNKELKQSIINLNNLDNNSLINYTKPILPIIRNILNIKYDTYNINIFRCFFNDITLKLNIYEYYFIRLSPSHFKIYMDLKNNKIISRTINYNIYRINYKDLYNLNEKELIDHYNNFAIKENRDDNFIDLNFNWKIYVYLNKDLKFTNLYDSYSHYINYGKNENRLPSYDDINFIWNTDKDEYEEYINYLKTKNK